MKLIPTLSTLVLLAVAPLGAAAQQAQSALSVTAQNRTAAAEAERGAPRRDAAARPGDVLRYRLSFTNRVGRTVRGVVFSDPIPAGLHFVGGSTRASRADTRAEFSADGGRTFSVRPMEEVVVDGQRVQRPVPAERYTHVRWTVGGEVAPGATVTAEFDAQVRASAGAPGTAASPAAGNGGR